MYNIQCIPHVKINKKLRVKFCIFCYLSAKAFVLGSQNNRLNETVLLGTTAYVLVKN